MIHISFRTNSENISVELSSSTSANCQNFKSFLIIHVPQSIDAIRGDSPCILYVHYTLKDFIDSYNYPNPSEKTCSGK